MPPQDSRESVLSERPVSLARLKLLPGGDEVLHFPKRGGDDAGCAKPERIDGVEYVARVLAQIPQPRKHLVRYHGFYSNAARGKRRRDQASQLEQDASATAQAPLPRPADAALHSYPMTKIIEDRFSDALVMKGSDCDLSIDSKRGELVFERHALLRRSRRRVFRLDALADLRLRVSERPALDVGVALKFLGAAVQTVREGQDLDAVRLLTGSPRQLLLRIRARGDDGTIESVEEKLSVEGIVDFPGAEELAQKISAVTGLRAVALYALPGCGIEFQLTDGKSTSHLAVTSLPEDLTQLSPPSFDPSEFHGDHRIEEWSPGREARWRQPLSMLAPFLFLLALPCLAGTALALNKVVTGDPSSRNDYLIIAAFGLVCGAALAFVVSLLLPRTVVLDWDAREVRLQTWFSRRVIPFAEIARLQLEAKRVSTGGDSSHTKFAAALRVIRHDQAEGHPDAIQIVETTTFRNIDDPLWMTMPLLHELANALNVEARFVDYPSRDG